MSLKTECDTSGSEKIHIAEMIQGEKCAKGCTRKRMSEALNPLRKIIDVSGGRSF
jgi:hypothetical protein